MRVTNGQTLPYNTTQLTSLWFSLHQIWYIDTTVYVSTVYCIDIHYTDTYPMYFLFSISPFSVIYICSPCALLPLPPPACITCTLTASAFGSRLNLVAIRSHTPSIHSTSKLIKYTLALVCRVPEPLPKPHSIINFVACTNPKSATEYKLIQRYCDTFIKSKINWNKLMEPLHRRRLKNLILEHELRMETKTFRCFGEETVLDITTISNRRWNSKKYFSKKNVRLDPDMAFH